MNDRIPAFGTNPVKVKESQQETRRAAEKQQVISKVLNAAYATIRETYVTASLEAVSDNLIEVREGLYSGEIKAEVSVRTGAGMKTATVILKAEKSSPIINRIALCEELTKTLDQTEGSEETAMAEDIDRLKEKEAKLNTESEMKAKVESLLEQGMDLEAAWAEVLGLDKTAEHYDFNEPETNLNDPYRFKPANRLILGKNQLPEGMEPGDTIDIKGFTYRIESATTSMKGDKDGAQWILNLEESK